jgi:hypothetical protein
MKTATLVRSEGSGIYKLSEGFTTNQICDIRLNGKTVGLNHFSPLPESGGIDIFDPNVSDPNETVTVEVWQPAR